MRRRAAQHFFWPNEDAVGDGLCALRVMTSAELSISARLASCARCASPSRSRRPIRVCSERIQRKRKDATLHRGFLQVPPSLVFSYLSHSLFRYRLPSAARCTGRRCYAQHSCIRELHLRATTANREVPGHPAITAMRIVQEWLIHRPSMCETALPSAPGQSTIYHLLVL